MKRYYENQYYDAAFERCVDLLAQMLIKYGSKVLEQQQQKILNSVHFPDYWSAFDKESDSKRYQSYWKLCQGIMSGTAA